MMRFELVMCPESERAPVSVLESDNLGATVVEAIELLDCAWQIRDHDQGDRIVAESPAGRIPARDEPLDAI